MLLLQKMKGAKKDILSLDFQSLEQALIDLGEKKFRAKQVYEWLWKRACRDFDEMSNLSKDLRSRLKENFELSGLHVTSKQESNDGTIKMAFEVAPGKEMEGVLIPAQQRMTACISSQVGCSLACEFCATGKLDLLKNLTPAEIYDQVVYLNETALDKYGHRLSNIVLMGMGEPLLNYRNVMGAIDKITSEDGLGMSPKRITLSTAGIAKMIKRMGDEKVKFNLALSLHAANDEKRDKIMAINESNNLEVLREALQHFYRETGSRITFEYIVFNDFNDSLQDARERANFAKCVPCKINLIEYNPIGDGKFQNAEKDRIDQFADFLENTCNMIVNVRRSRGKDIDAACGQLANKNH